MRGQWYSQKGKNTEKLQTTVEEDILKKRTEITG